MKLILKKGLQILLIFLGIVFGGLGVNSVFPGMVINYGESEITYFQQDKYIFFCANSFDSFGFNVSEYDYTMLNNKILIRFYKTPHIFAGIRISYENFPYIHFTKSEKNIIAISKNDAIGKRIYYKNDDGTEILIDVNGDSKGTCGLK